MCGFAAFFQPGRRFPSDLLDAVDGDLVHRGPDSGGRAAAPGWALVFRRLAIMDPEAQSDQPMHDPDRGLSMVFNGEIFNFRDLRAALESDGARFRTESDSEVILRGYAHWGEAVFEKLAGMFAVLIVDRREHRMIAARDPFGIKPLYMTEGGGVVGFASEMRPLFRLARPVADPAAQGELLAFSWAAGSLSNVSGIERLPGGTLVSVDLATGALTRRRYRDPIDTLAQNGPRATAEEAEAALDASIKAHLMSDVGFSMQLSGGVDSSFIAARTGALGASAETSLTSFGVRIDNYEHDEAPFRAMVAESLGLDHTEVPLDGAAFADALPRAVRHMEGPVPHGGCVMLMLLCRTIRERGYKVVLTGEGADEFFGGYQRYGDWRRLAWRERLARLPVAKLLPNRPPFVGIRRFAGKDMAAYAALYHQLEPMRELFPDLIPPPPGDRERMSARFDDFRDRMLAVDQSSYLESLLVRQDKMSMAESIEARVPFVHWPLAMVLNRLPHALRIPGGTTKPILKRFAEKWLPHDVIHRRKIGLWLPYDQWLREPDTLGRYLDLVADPNGRLAGFGDARKLAEAVDRFRRGVPGGPRMWTLVNQELWLRSLEETA
jgi:asparagine synthase (glutamine-hydrolysing)